MTPYITKLIERPADHKQFLVLLGMDALRACVGLKPRNFTVTEIIQTLHLLEGANTTTQPTESQFQQGDGK